MDPSRRAFLKQSVAVAGAANAAGAFAAAAGGAEDGAAGAAPPAMASASNPASAAIGPGPVAITLTVNTVRRTLEATPSTTLAAALRDHLGLTGTKIGCDRGSCGACTVWLDATPVPSCMVLAVDIGDRPVTTIEGLAKGDLLHPLQSAFIAHDAMQCGFCTPGLVMSGAALLARTPDPSEDDVREAISGHVCRCGSLPHAIAAILAAAKHAKG